MSATAEKTQGNGGDPNGPKRDKPDRDRARQRERGGARRRSASRLAAVQALYQIDLTGAAAEAVIGEFARHRLDELDGERIVRADEGFFAELVGGASQKRGALDDMIAGVLAESWSVDRLETILHMIMRVAAYELSTRLDIPPRATISEYVDLADAFFGGKETGLVNGVLDRLARGLRPDEMGAARREPDPPAG
jgi:N utilization substance protein B